ncbi:LPS translocon maturation chaperone LptM [Pseudoxanthomonas sp.]|jgi:predicted small lipoprotein YifL|uniref:LPS translocon maturation chaperone LptM n=1 Tax=Pseudoxanthomonas sp. TaxID=1871049 RepID=UPI003F805799
MNRTLRLLSAAILMAFLAACGAKGPLFLPEKPAPETEVPAEAPVEPAAEGTETPPADSTDTATPPAEPAKPANPPSTP